MKLGPQYKIAKRLGAQIFPKTQTQRFVLSKERTAKNKKGRRGGSDYSRQLIEKQKLRLSYGLSEKQFSNYVAKALESQHPQANLFGSLETRLDSVAHRMGLAASQRGARQLVSHGHLLVNGKRVTIPSYRVSVGDTVSIREGSKAGPMFGGLSDKLKEFRFPSWAEFDAGTMEGKLKSAPEFREQDAAADLGAVFEFYTR
jgi:small subunit ribosomal protein S4